MSTPKQCWKTMAALAMALALNAGNAVAAEKATHTHGHDHAAAPASLTLNNGKKWESDEALRKGMENIRNTMDAALQQIHQGKLSNAGYQTLAKKLNGELGNIVANCKLEAKADAQLHLVVADLAEGIDAMAGKVKKTKRQSGALKVLGALDKYSNHFDHPDWNAIQH